MREPVLKLVIVCGVWMIYLNDINDRGWTEFFYQQHYEIPKAGKIVCCLCDWTHTHRGIVSPTETKYILTGLHILILKQGRK